MNGIGELYQFDWNSIIAGARVWLASGDPYAALSWDATKSTFAYPPTMLPWLALFVPLGGLGYYVWTLLTLALWWRIVGRDPALRGQAVLLLWSPVALGLVMGQSTLMVVLVLWAASRAPQRGFWWGLALAWALTKPQVALLPLLWLLWQDRRAATRWQLLGGVVLGTLLLALPATLREPQIWLRWLASLGLYRGRVLQLAAWQGWSALLVAFVAYRWHKSQIGGWQWFATAALFPYTSVYSMVALLPALRPRQSGWTLAALGLAGVLQGPMTPVTLPWILALHLLAGWLLARQTPERGVATDDTATPDARAGRRYG